MPNKTVLIAAGGTGGHVFPGLAVAQELQSRGYSVEWIGTKEGLESRVVPVNGIKLSFFPVYGIRGRGLWPVLMAPFNILRSIWCATRIVRKIKPVLVIGLGGFVAGPVGVAAVLSRVFLVIHEQNAVAGTSNRLLSKIAHRVLVAFPIGLKNAQVIGNPLRASLESVEKHAVLSDGPIRLLVVGGSRGAKALNTRLPSALVDAGVADRIAIRHQCGEGRLAEAQAAYEKCGVNAEIIEFIEDIDAMMAWADFIVCRAGALTVSEIASVGLPSILIPFPYAIDDHQTANAEYLEKAGAAVIVQERDFDQGKLSDSLRDILTQPDKIQAMAKKTKASASLGSTNRFVDICEALLQ